MVYEEVFSNKEPILVWLFNVECNDAFVIDYGVHFSECKDKFN